MALRREIAYACAVLENLSVLYTRGIIDADTWLIEVRAVIACVEAGVVPRPHHRAAFAARARPAVPDPPDEGTTEGARWFAQRDSVDADPMLAQVA